MYIKQCIFNTVVFYLNKSPSRDPVCRIIGMDDGWRDGWKSLSPVTANLPSPLLEW